MSVWADRWPSPADRPRPVPAGQPGTAVNRLASAIRVGIDLASVPEVRRSVAQFGDRYLRRIFTPHELESCGPPGQPSPERLAARFVAKEATLKVLRVSDGQPPWTTMEVRRHPNGWCEMVLSGEASRLANAEGLSQPFSLSLSHDADMAMAVVATFSVAPPLGTPSGC